MKKLKIMILIIIITFSFFLLMYNRKRSYVLSYKVNKYNVTEEYKKKDKIYLVSVSSDKYTYDFIIDSKYTKKRKIVTSIKEVKNDNESCLTLRFNNKEVYPLCYKDKFLISYDLASNDIKNKMKKSYKNDFKIKTSKKSYENIDINYLNNKKIFVWNYHGFYVLNNDKQKTINLFKRDIYKPNLIGSVENYMILPDYDNMYEYSDFKIMNVENGSIKDFKISESISDDAYILGVNDKSLFIYDPKYKREFEIVLYKQKYRIVDPFIYNKGEKEYKSETTLSYNKNIHFIYDTIYDYKLIDNKLYQLNKYNSNKRLVSDLEIKYIVKSDENQVYYISGDSLYMYSDKTGNVKLFSYFELEFNYENLIYIFD